eukprot:TRINITY_DN2118_c0_g1_i1.p2 TRINITY_DN2118_c0_g1~~TRINITY_DN2118_c0_g1_i1.p2  ORF type:complete len:137 (+),score=25.95 TRINITY_DN2118_c0_g1_i1:53-463(+)
MRTVVCVLLLACIAHAGVESFTGYLTDNTPSWLDLVNSKCTLYHGQFITSPPTTIAAGSSVSWSMSSIGLGQIDAKCSYTIRGTPYTLNIGWNCPEIGTNNYTAEVVPAGSDYSATYAISGSTYDIIAKYDIKLIA